MEDSFDLLAIRNETFLEAVSFHDELDSTNSVAADLAATDCKTPLLVLAERQTAGRGRGSNSWWSSSGSLTFSVLLDLPTMASDRFSTYSLTVGLAVCRTLEQFAPLADLAVKWPNDVYMNGRKACGILIERPVASKPRLVVGIGINVNNSRMDAPPELREKVTSLLHETRSSADRTAVLVRCLGQLETCTAEHISQPAEMLDQWRAYCMLTGRDVCIDIAGESIRGRCQGIDVDGSLLVYDGSDLRRCNSGVVSRW